MKLSDSPARLRRPSPELGAHTDEVLSEAPWEEQIGELRPQKPFADRALRTRSDAPR